jgi:thioredoxin 1
MEQLAEEYQGKVKVVGLNVDNAPDTAASLGVMSIPVIIFFKDGKEAGRIVGGNRDKIAGEMDKLL